MEIKAMEEGEEDSRVQSPMALVTTPDGKKPVIRGTHLGWTLNLSATATRRGASGKSVTVKQTILEGVTGSVRSGNMMALMGASGAGKSSLLDCISLRNQKFDGHVFVDGKPADNTFFGLTAYVYQDDLFFPTLSVREHLRFHAMVRMPKEIQSHIKDEKVESILLDVGLQGCADALIGGSNSLIRGISGGERKRVAVATELLSNPAILFLDEPTSGLDSFMAEAVCILLRKLANTGKIVVCVIHQPSSDTFNLFTHLCLLAKGRVAYLGERSKAVDYFAALGTKCPANFNPADFFIEELAVVPSEYESSMARLRGVTDAYAESDLRKANDKWFGRLSPEVLAKPRKKTGIAITEYPATAETQFWESCKRTVLQYKREPVLTRARLVNSILMGSLLGLVYFGQDDTYKAVQNKIGVAFIVTINQCISATFGVVQEVPRDFAVFMREYLAGANRVGSYFMARTVSEIPFQVLFPFVFGSIVYGMVGLRPTGDAYFTFIMTLILCANAAVAMGYALSAILRNTTAAIAAGSVVIMPMALFSGLLLDMDNIATWLRPLQYFSIIRYTYHAIIINEYANQPINCGFNVICPFRNGNAVLTYVGAAPDELSFNMGMLFVFMLGFRLVAFLALKWHSTRVASL